MTNTSKRSLEAYKIFPFVAWIVTICFSVFVYNIVLELQAVTEEIKNHAKLLEESASNNSPTL